MRDTTKAMILLTLSLNLGQMNGQPKDLRNMAGQKKTDTTTQTVSEQRSIVMFGQPITEKRTPMPVVEISPQQRKWVIEAFLEQVRIFRQEAGVKGPIVWNAILADGAQDYADTLTTASDEQWERWGHALGGPMAKHTRNSKDAGCNVLAECLARDWHNTDPSKFGENEWREIGAKAAWSMKLFKDQTAHYAALIMDATESKTGRRPAKTKENKIGMGFSMHTQKIGAGANPLTEWVSNLVFWIAHP